MINLERLSKILEDGKFDTSTADGILAGSKENPNYSLEVTIDSAGSCLIKKIVMGKQSSKSVFLLNQKVSKISFSSKTSQIRVKLVSENNLLEVINFISTPLF